MTAYSLGDENHWTVGIMQLAETIGEPVPVDPEWQTAIAAEMQQHIRDSGPGPDCSEADCPGVTFDDQVTAYKLPDDEWYVYIGRGRCRHTSTKLASMTRIEWQA